MRNFPNALPVTGFHEFDMLWRSYVEATDSLTSTSLIRSAKAYDAEAWEQLVHTYGRRVYRWSRLAGLQPADASNVVQEVLRSVGPQPSWLSAWKRWQFVSRLD